MKHKTHIKIIMPYHDMCSTSQDNKNMEDPIPGLYCVALWVVTLNKLGNRQLKLFSAKVFNLFVS